MTARKKILAALLCCVGLFTAFANDTSDPRIKKALDSIKLKYSLTSSNNYQLVFTINESGDRSQTVFIDSQTEKYGDIEIREIWSLAAVLSSRPGNDLLFELLQYNSTVKMGAWGVEENDDGEFMLFFMVTLPADPKPTMLRDILYFVAEVSDELEAQLTGEDEN